MKTLVAILGLFFLVNSAFALGHTIENYESRESRENMKAYLNVLGQVDMIAQEVKNVFVINTAKYIMSGNLENNQGPMLKKIDNTTNFWSAVITYYESAQNVFYINFFEKFNEPAFDYVVKCYALEVVFAILDYYGNDEYKKHIEQTTFDIQGKMIRGEDIYPVDLLNIKKTDSFFSITSLSDEERYYKALMVWLRCYFLAIEKSIVTDIEVQAEKLRYVKHAVDNEVL